MSKERKRRAARIAAREQRTAELIGVLHAGAWFIDRDSVLRGVREMRRGHPSPARWHLRRVRGFRFWLHAWTPRWDEGRGPYLSLGLGILGVYRGY